MSPSGDAAAAPVVEPEAELAAIARRFEAVILDWDGTAVVDRRADASLVRLLIEDACALGLHVAVVSGTNARNIDSQLAARPRGPGRLYLLTDRGSEVFQVGPRGPRLLARRRATPAEKTALTKAAELVVAGLEERGLQVATISDRLNRCKIDLIPEPDWAEPPKDRLGMLVLEVEGRLARHGVGGLADAVELAGQAARQAGLRDPRVTSDGKYVEIGLTDKSDSARWIAAELRRRGIGAGLVLIVGDEFGSLGARYGSDALLLVPELGRATAVSVGPEPGRVPEGVLHLGGGPVSFVRIVADQLERRRRGDVPELDEDPRWTLVIDGFDAHLERARESLLTLANGRLGTRGSLLVRHPASRPLVLAAGLYDGLGPAEELMPCPRWARLSTDLPELTAVRRVLDLRTGLLRQEILLAERWLESILFSSPVGPGLTVVRASGSRRVRVPTTPIELPGTGHGELHHSRAGSALAIVRASPSGGVVTAAIEDRPVMENEGRFDRLAAYAVGVRRLPASESPRRRLDTLDRRFESLLTQHRRAWARRWEEAELTIEGDPELELAARFAVFHLLSSVADRGEAPLGAKGLSGLGYRGHVFWDADVFCLPGLAAIRPQAARAMLEYRRRRLPAAQANARALGYEGARFPWESARDGIDVTPPAGLDLSGATVPIRTGDLEEHISADVAWAAAFYLDWTGDGGYAQAARELIVETARYWASRIQVDADGRGHIEHVIGPDEYHEAVDDNAFTNVMARWNLRRAAQESGQPTAERKRWIELADAIVDGYDPSTGLYEQFAGFFALEPLVIADLAPRRPIAADAVLDRDQIARGQVLKQADVLMLHHLVPDEIAAGSLEPNLAFYEPRTSHGSSLSPGIHASLLARAGRLEEALRWLRLTSRIDLDDVAGTTADGLHLATIGSLWQAFAFGFLGLRAQGEALVFDPRLPADWRALELRLRFRGARVRLRAEHETMTVWAQPQAILRPAGADTLIAGRHPLRLERTDEGWKAR